MTTSRTHEVKISGEGSMIPVEELRWLLNQLGTGPNTPAVRIAYHASTDQRDTTTWSFTAAIADTTPPSKLCGHIGNCRCGGRPRTPDTHPMGPGVSYVDMSEGGTR